MLLGEDEEPDLPLFLKGGLGEQEGMLAEFFDIAQDEEGVLNLSLLDEVLEGLVLEHETIDLRLDVSQRKPNDKVCLKWQLIVFKRSP